MRGRRQNLVSVGISPDRRQLEAAATLAKDSFAALCVLCAFAVKAF
jgi:hypothetical protein